MFDTSSSIGRTLSAIISDIKKDGMKYRNNRISYHKFYDASDVSSIDSEKYETKIINQNESRSNNVTDTYCIILDLIDNRIRYIVLSIFIFNFSYLWRLYS